MLRTLARSAADTEAFGARLARARPAADALAVIYLTGDLGAGKTTLVRGLLRAAGVEAPVRSPTYTLVEPYALAGQTALHVDLYRLRAATELEPLGLRDWAAPGYLWLIEWPERAAGALPPPDLELRLTVKEGGHAIEAHAASPVGERWLAASTGSDTAPSPRSP